MSLAPTEKKYVGHFDMKKLSYLKKNAKPLTAISLFSGCGGAALGLRKAGFEVRVFVEWDKYACETLKANWVGPDKSVKQKRDPEILQGDIREITTQQILEAAGLRVGEATILEGGFPCQGFSYANNRRDDEDHTKDGRNLLYLECVRVIREALPKTLMLENVPGLVSMEKGKVIRMICNDLAQSGYTVNWDVLNAADYGVPQNRRRVFILGQRVDVLRVPPGDGPAQLHIGGAPGRIHHPAWFQRKYPEHTQASLFRDLQKTTV